MSITALSQIRAFVYSILQHAVKGDWDGVIACADTIRYLAEEAKQQQEQDHAD